MNKIESPSDLRHLIEHGQLPVLLIFTAEGCRHSEELLARLESFQKAMKFGVDVVSFEISQDPPLAWAYLVQATPTTMLIHRGIHIHKWVGVHRYHSYFDSCQALLDSTPVNMEEILSSVDDGTEDVFE